MHEWPRSENCKRTISMFYLLKRSGVKCEHLCRMQSPYRPEWIIEQNVKLDGRTCSYLVCIVVQYEFVIDIDGDENRMKLWLKNVIKRSRACRLAGSVKDWLFLPHVDGIPASNGVTRYQYPHGQCGSIPWSPHQLRRMPRRAWRYHGDYWRPVPGQICV